MTHLQRLAITPSQLAYPHITLTPDQQHYLSRVLRLRVGDRFIAIDGQGHWWLSELEASPDQARVIEAIAIQTELPVSLILLVAMPKGNGMDDLVRQVTELGVAEIVPVISDRTLMNPSVQKIERWRRIAQEAAEQSERQIIPVVHDPLSWRDSLTRWNGIQFTGYLCCARGNSPHLLTQLLSFSPSSLSTLLLATGPEGGWTETEVDLAIAAGYHPVSLGSRILRAVTAPVVAVSLLASAIESIPESRETV